MKPAALVSALFLLCASTVKGQFTLLPQIGFENAKVTVDQKSTSPFNYAGATMGSSIANLKANLRLDYRFPKGFGPYISVGTKPAVYEYNFEPGTPTGNIMSTKSNLQFKLEGGYQYTSKAIKLKKSSAPTSKSTTEQKTSTHSTCGGFYHHCGGDNQKTKSTSANKDLILRIQPSLGFAYDPSTTDGVTTKSSAQTNANFSSTYAYTAGDWKTAVVSGVGFELGKGKQRLMTLSVNYTYGIGNLGNKTITQEFAGKPYEHSFSSTSSNWGMTLGIPIGLAKKQHTTSKSTSYKTQEKTDCRSRCDSYRRCPRRI